jgi:hypothetical protein
MLSGVATVKLPIEHLFDQVEWEVLPLMGGTDVPVATHRGVLHLGALELVVYQLSDGRRVISEESLRPLIGGLD